MEKEYNKNEAIKKSKNKLIGIKNLLNNYKVDLSSELVTSKEEEKKYSKRASLLLIVSLVMALPGIYYLIGFVIDISSKLGNVLWNLSGLSVLVGGAIAFIAQSCNNKSESCRINSIKLEKKLDEAIKSEELINEAYSMLDEKDEVKTEIENNTAVKVVGYEDSYTDEIVSGFSSQQYCKEEVLERKLIRE